MVCHSRLVDRAFRRTSRQTEPHVQALARRQILRRGIALQGPAMEKLRAPCRGTDLEGRAYRSWAEEVVETMQAFEAPIDLQERIDWPRAFGR